MESANSWRSWSKSTASFRLPSSPLASVTQPGNSSRIRAILSWVRLGECIFRLSILLSFCRSNSLAHSFKLVFQLPQVGIDFHLAVELFFLGQLCGFFFHLALLGADLAHPLHLLGKAFLRPCRQRDQALQ